MNAGKYQERTLRLILVDALRSGRVSERGVTVGTRTGCVCLHRDRHACHGLKPTERGYPLQNREDVVLYTASVLICACKGIGAIARYFLKRVE